MKRVLPRQHYTVKQAAERLGHGPAWVRKKILSGELEGFKHSRSDITVSLESIISYEESRRMCVITIAPASLGPTDKRLEEIAPAS